MVHARRVDEARAKKKHRDSKMARSFEGRATKIGLRFKTRLNSRRDSQIKFHPNFLRLVMTRSLGRNSIRGRFGVLLMRNLLVPNVERVILVNA